MHFEDGNWLQLAADLVSIFKATISKQDDHNWSLLQSPTTVFPNVTVV